MVYRIPILDWASVYDTGRRLFQPRDNRLRQILRIENRNSTVPSFGFCYSPDAPQHKMNCFPRFSWQTDQHPLKKQNPHNKNAEILAPSSLSFCFRSYHYCLSTSITFDLHDIPNCRRWSGPITYGIVSL